MERPEGEELGHLGKTKNSEAGGDGGPDLTGLHRDCCCFVPQWFEGRKSLSNSLGIERHIHSEGMEKIKGNEKKKAGVPKLRSAKIDFKTKAVTPSSYKEFVLVFIQRQLLDIF